MAQEFDILGEGQLQLSWGDRVLPRHSKQIVAALQNKKTVHCHSPQQNFLQLTLICHSPPIARRIHVRNEAQTMIENANSADAATNADLADPVTSR